MFKIVWTMEIISIFSICLIHSASIFSAHSSIPPLNLPKSASTRFEKPDEPQKTCYTIKISVSQSAIDRDKIEVTTPIHQESKPNIITSNNINNSKAPSPVPPGLEIAIKEVVKLEYSNEPDVMFRRIPEYSRKVVYDSEPISNLISTVTQKFDKGSFLSDLNKTYLASKPKNTSFRKKIPIPSSVAQANGKNFVLKHLGENFVVSSYGELIKTFSSLNDDWHELFFPLFYLCHNASYLDLFDKTSSTYLEQDEKQLGLLRFSKVSARYANAIYWFTLANLDRAVLDFGASLSSAWLGEKKPRNIIKSDYAQYYVHGIVNGTRTLILKSLGVLFPMADGAPEDIGITLKPEDIGRLRKEWRDLCQEKYAEMCRKREWGFCSNENRINFNY